jgi:hypothetical protein
MVSFLREEVSPDMPISYTREVDGPLHAQVDRLGRKCLESGRLSSADARDFRQTVGELAPIYKEHIRIADELVFPVAGKVLSSTDKAAIAAEMAARRK